MSGDYELFVVENIRREGDTIKYQKRFLRFPPGYEPASQLLESCRLARHFVETLYSQGRYAKVEEELGPDIIVEEEALALPPPADPNDKDDFLISVEFGPYRIAGSDKQTVFVEITNEDTRSIPNLDVLFQVEYERGQPHQTVRELVAFGAHAGFESNEAGSLGPKQRREFVLNPDSIEPISKGIAALSPERYGIIAKINGRSELLIEGSKIGALIDQIAQ